MAIYQPLQRTDGRFDYTCTNDAGTFPVGFCMSKGRAPFYSLPYSEVSDVVRNLYETEERWEAEKARHAPHLHRYHDDGHATADEAIGCYRLYEVLECCHRIVDDENQRKCGICGKWTQHLALIGHVIPHEYACCEECGTFDNLMKLHMQRDKVAAG